MTKYALKYKLHYHQGPDAMEKLAEESELHRNFLLPPLPIQQASQQYEANFRATMGIVGSEVKGFFLTAVFFSNWCNASPN
jgi:hypothetical protein